MPGSIKTQAVKGKGGGTAHDKEEEIGESCECDPVVWAGDLNTDYSRNT